jgi:hypothetical protein
MTGCFLLKLREHDQVLRSAIGDLTNPSATGTLNGRPLSQGPLKSIDTSIHELESLDCSSEPFDKHLLQIMGLQRNWGRVYVCIRVPRLLACLIFDQNTSETCCSRYRAEYIEGAA